MRMSKEMKELKEKKQELLMKIDNLYYELLELDREGSYKVIKDTMFYGRGYGDGVEESYEERTKLRESISNNYLN